MHDQGRRSTDQPDHPSMRREEQDSGESEYEIGATSFPMFTEAPFLTWYHRHLKSSLCRQLHPTATPVILLWDESEEDLLLESNH